MTELEKKYIIDKNRMIIYNVSKGYAKPTYTFTEGFLENGDVKKTYSFSQWDDYGFSAWVNKEEIENNRISFEFDITHPLYIPLLHLLNYDKELVIDDDNTRERQKKYMSIRREEGKIFIEFIDGISSRFSDRFHVFIKNIGPDGRSKIDWDHSDTKQRLYVFFNEVHELFTSEYHQISIEEYLLHKSVDNACEDIKKYYKRKP